MRKNVIDTINKNYVNIPVGGWVILAYAGQVGNKQTAWGLCVHCSSVARVRWGNIQRPCSNGCGCKKLKRMGLGASPESQAYTDMLHRCGGNDKWKRRKDAKHWEGRGITVCDEWRNSFAAFYEHVGKRPSPNYTLDRIDNGKGYEPGNVRWADRKQQARNRRSNEFITYKGVTKCLAEWAEEYEIKLGTLHARLRYSKWPVEKALLTPVGKI